MANPPEGGFYTAFPPLARGITDQQLGSQVTHRGTLGLDVGSDVGSRRSSASYESRSPFSSSFSSPALGQQPLAAYNHVETDGNGNVFGLRQLDAYSSSSLSSPSPQMGQYVSDLMQTNRELKVALEESRRHNQQLLGSLRDSPANAVKAESGEISATHLHNSIASTRDSAPHSITKPCDSCGVRRLEIVPLAPFPIREDYPLVRHWTKADWKESAEGRGDVDQGEPEKLDFLQDKDGNVLGADAVAAIRLDIRSLLQSLIAVDGCPLVWSAAEHEPREYLRGKLFSRYPALYLCDNTEWKLNHIITNMWGSFKNARKPEFEAIKRRQELRRAAGLQAAEAVPRKDGLHIAGVNEKVASSSAHNDLKRRADSVGRNSGFSKTFKKSRGASELTSTLVSAFQPPLPGGQHIKSASASKKPDSLRTSVLKGSASASDSGSGSADASPAPQTCLLPISPGSPASALSTANSDLYGSSSSLPGAPQTCLLPISPGSPASALSAADSDLYGWSSSLPRAAVPDLALPDQPISLEVETPHSSDPTVGDMEGPGPATPLPGMGLQVPSPSTVGLHDTPHITTQHSHSTELGLQNLVQDSDIDNSDVLPATATETEASQSVALPRSTSASEKAGDSTELTEGDTTELSMPKAHAAENPLHQWLGSPAPFPSGSNLLDNDQPASSEHTTSTNHTDPLAPAAPLSTPPNDQTGLQNGAPTGGSQGPEQARGENLVLSGPVTGTVRLIRPRGSAKQLCKNQWLKDKDASLKEEKVSESEADKLYEKHWKDLGSNGRQIWFDAFAAQQAEKKESRKGAKKN